MAVQPLSTRTTPRSSPSLPAESALRLLCDEMLQGLGRWLRAAGYDTAIEVGGRSDRHLLERAVEENRIVVTRDRGLSAHRAAQGRTIVLHGNSTAECAAELRRRLAIDWCLQPFSRCLLCNTTLMAASAEQMGRIPSASRALITTAYACPRCNKVYWEGSHVRRMWRQLQRWRRGQVAGPPVGQPD